jgi:hypothetical protein
MLSEWELWACANRVLQSDGEIDSLHAAEQIEGLAQAGDADGARAWRAIARRIGQLGKNGSTPIH